MFKAIVRAVRGCGGDGHAEVRAEYLDTGIRQYDILEFVRSYQQERASN
jgi:hypothetical protein